MTTQPDLMVAQLVLDYLQHADSIAAGVPDEETLPKGLMDSGEKNEPPALVIVAKESDGSDAYRKIQVRPVLLTWLKSTAAGAAAVQNQSTREDASTWLRSIDARLADMDGWAAFLESLPEDRLCGWTLLDLPRRSSDLVMRDKDNAAVISYGLTWEWKIVVE
jgi:hypothetical protein